MIYFNVDGRTFSIEMTSNIISVTVEDLSSFISLVNKSVSPDKCPPLYNNVSNSCYAFLPFEVSTTTLKGKRYTKKDELEEVQLCNEIVIKMCL